MDLHISLEGVRDLAGQLYRQLRSAILEGRLTAGEQLPPTRELADRLGVSRNTVTDAYDRLMSEGFLAGRVGAGTYIAEGVSASRYHAAAERAGANIQTREIWGAAAAPRPPRPPDPLLYDFRVGLPDKAHFPFNIWGRISARELRAFAKTPAVRGSPAGEPELRGAIAKYVAFTRAVICDRRDVIVTSGTQQALDLIGRALIEPGTVVGVEEPGYRQARASFLSHGAQVIGVPLDAEGLMVDQLSEAAKVVYVTPSHQFPLGMPMSLSRRIALLEWAQARGAVIIEDDYDSEYRFEGRPLESLQNLDRSGLVVYVGTFSKVLFPALRLGFLVAPPSLRRTLLTAKALTDSFSHVLDQATLARFIQDGHLAKHIRKMRKIYAGRRRLLLDSLARDFGEWLTPIPTAAGLHVATFLKEAIEGDVVVQEAQQYGIAVDSLTPHYSGTPAQSGLLFGYGAIEENGIKEGLNRLLRALRDASNLPAAKRRSNRRANE